LTLLEKYIIARWCYAIGEETIGDVEYNSIHNKLKEEFPDNEYVNRSWSDDPCPIELLEKYNMMELYRDIKFSHKSESIESLNTEDAVERMFYSLDERSRLSYKLDGFNIQVNYYNRKSISAETRGRTGNSLNANVVLKIVPQTITLSGKVKVTGELVIRKDLWELFKEETGGKSQRSSVATAMARGMTDYLTFVAFGIQTEGEIITRDVYDVLDELGFMTPMKLYVSNYTGLLKAINLLGKRYSTYRYPADGLVIENSKCQYAIRIEAFKEKELMSYVTGYERKHGIYKMPLVVTIRPVTYDGRENSAVSVTNLHYVLDCELKIGSPIAFDIRSMANAVLNVERTMALHEEWKGRYDKFRDLIEESDYAKKAEV